MVYVKPSAKQFDIQAAQTYDLPEYDKELWPKEGVAEIINNSFV